MARWRAAPRALLGVLLVSAWAPARAAEVSAAEAEAVPAASVAQGDFRMDSVSCPSDLKVYVYEYPGMEDMRWYALARAQRQACIDEGVRCANHFAGEHLLAQFSLELVLHDFFAQSCVRTHDAEKADLFFVPHYADLQYRDNGRKAAPSVFEQALLDVVEDGDTVGWKKHFNTTDKWWHRRGGADHILVQAAPVTGLRHPKGKRGFAHYMQQLTPPIWLSIELSRSFVAEYPTCSRKNIVLPYPVPGRGWHDGTWRGQARRVAEEAFTHPAAGEARPLRIYNQAGNHGCVNVRMGIKRELATATPEYGGVKSPSYVLEAGFSMGSAHKTAKFHSARQAMMHLSSFCPCPEGDSPSAKRHYDAILAGCVPVLISDDALWAFAQEFGFGELDPGLFALRIPEEAMTQHGGVGSNATTFPMLKHIAAVDATRLAALRQAGTQAAHFYRYYAARNYGKQDPLVSQAFPDGGALAMLVHELAKRAKGARWPKCESELRRPHYALSKQYCGAVPVESELNVLRQRLKQSPGDTSIMKAMDAYKKGRVYRR
ncbi:exostosin family-domain-containing protein [Pelagophyceae sp. CCMP2097]|nr:exostosin family-domain-containing protein [Pelagophyceae sp. CCMP2097]|mmetsp:Transcript_15104/g.50722  ORF Transcript_15104/g.50722 Transcript_15104/m.50722 type:complete len:545 (+) Transcript_15104:104-1738(+)